MRVTRVDVDGEAAYDLTGMTAEQAELLGALADFPEWGHQPARVSAFCAALHGAVLDAIPWRDGHAPDANAHGMAPNTTVDLN